MVVARQIVEMKKAVCQDEMVKMEKAAFLDFFLFFSFSLEEDLLGGLLQIAKYLL